MTEAGLAALSCVCLTCTDVRGRVDAELDNKTPSRHQLLFVTSSTQCPLREPSALTVASGATQRQQRILKKTLKLQSEDIFDHILNLSFAFIQTGES